MEGNEDDKVVPRPVADIGNGYKTLFQSAMGSQVQITGIDPGTAKSTMEISVCSSTTELYKALGISASVAASSSFGSFEARVDFVNQIQISATSVAVLVVAERIDGGKSIRTAEFTTTPSSALSIYRQGGDSYVSSVSTGGIYIAAFNYATYDEDTFQQIRAEADASFSGWTGGIDAKFLADIQSVGKTTNTTSRFNQIGIGFTAPLPTTMEHFITFVDTFGTVDLDRPAILDFSTESYLSLEGCPEEFTQIDDYMDDWNGSQDIDPRPRLASIVSRVHVNEKIIKEVTELYKFYGCLSVDGNLPKAPKDCQTVLQQIYDWRKQVDRDPTKPGIPIPAIDAKYLQYPVPKYSLQASAGGPGGGDSYFEDISYDLIGRHVRPMKVTACSGEFVTQVEIQYRVALGDTQDNWTVHHGGNTGNPAGSITFGPGETVVTISPKWADGDTNVRNVVIGTSTETVVLGPTEDFPNGAPWNSTAATCLVGFAGFSKSLLRSLKAQYVLFSPCDWEDGFGPAFVSRPFVRSARRRHRSFRHYGRSGPPIEVIIDVIRFIKAYLGDNFGKVASIFKQKGGWEGWLQVELAEYIKQNYSSIPLLREARIYPNFPRKSADILMTNIGAEEISPDSYVIELKTEGAYRDATDPWYVFNGVKDDIEKIATGQLDESLRRTKAFVIGVIITNTTANRWSNYLWIKGYGLPVLHKYGRPIIGTDYQLYLIEWNWQNYNDMDGAEQERIEEVPGWDIVN